MTNLRYRFQHSRLNQFIQRGQRGYSDADLWSFDSYLSGLLHRAITQYAHDTNGYPGGLSEQQWAKILAEMAEGFRIHAACNYPVFTASHDYEEYKKQIERQDAKLQKSLRLLKKYYHDLWW